MKGKRDVMLDRREFLKVSVGAGAILFAGEMLTAGASAKTKQKFVETEKLSITVLTDNYYDAMRADTPICKRFRSSVEKPIHAEHGLSFYVETSTAGKGSSFLFDYGVDARGVMKNMDFLGITLEKLDGLGLSHGHWDHWGALVDIISANKGKIAKNMPLYVGEEAFSARFSVREGAAPRSIGKLDRQAVESLGLKIIEVRDPTEVMKGGYYTGNIEKVTDYEKAPASFFVKRGEKLVHDEFPGEQAMVFKLKGKGLVVLASCAHPGIINTAKYVQKMFGGEKFHAIVGGFHLVNAKPEVLQRTVADIKALSPDYIIPMHCTGFEAMALLQKEMPNQFILNTAGTKYVF